MKARTFFSRMLHALGQFFTGSGHSDPKLCPRPPIVEPLEARVVLSGSLPFTDGDGDLYTVKISGPGMADVVQLPDGSIDSITLHDTTLKSGLSITVKKPAHGIGDGKVMVGRITGTPLKSIVAPKTDLVGTGIALGTPLARLAVDNLLSGADIVLGGAPGSGAKFTLGDVGDGSNITSPSAISSLTAQRFGEATITAPSIGMLLTKAGAMAANLNVSGPIKSISVKGGDAEGDWTAATFGSVSVTLGGLHGTLFATATAASLGNKLAIGSVTVAGGDFAADLRAFGAVGSISVTGKKNAAGTLVGGMVVGSTLTAKSFDKVTVKGDFMQTVLLAGADLGADGALGGVGANADFFGPGSISRFVVSGTVGSASRVGAGFGSVDNKFKNADDFIAPGNPPMPSKIGKFAVGAAMADSYFRAGFFPKTVLINGAKVNPLTDSRFLPTVDMTAPAFTAALANDTGVSASDGLTSDAMISGTIVDGNPITQFGAMIDGLAAANFVDVLATVNANGQFTFSSSLLETINGAPLPDGPHTLHLEARNSLGNASAPFDLTFTLDTTAPNFLLTPTDRAQDVLPRELVVATFSEPVFIGMKTDTGFVADATGTLTLEAGGSPLTGRLVPDRGGNRLTFVPAGDLPGNMEISATIEASKIFDLAGNAALALPETAKFRTINTVGIPGTKVVGFVFDSARDAMDQNIPLANATVAVANAPNIHTVTDANGRFELLDTPAGKLMIDVDGHTVGAAAGTFYPTVAELVQAVPGQTNTFPSPIFLPLAHTADFVPIDNTNGAMTMVTNARELPGWQLMVPGGSVERRDGTIADQVLIAPVAPNRLPAPLPPGMNPAVVITIQTQGGADVFNQPVAITAPNLEGLSPGAKTTLWDFDHARGEFVPTGTATVSADGQTVTTDPGQGVVRPGWHFISDLIRAGARPLLGPAVDRPSIDAGALALNLAKLGLSTATVVTDFLQFAPSPTGALAGLVNSAVDGARESIEGPDKQAGAVQDAVKEAAFGGAEQAGETLEMAAERLENAANATRTERLVQPLENAAKITGFTGKVLSTAGGLFKLSKLLKIPDHFKRLGEDFDTVREQLVDPPGDVEDQLITRIDRASALANEVANDFFEAAAQFEEGVAALLRIGAAVNDLPRETVLTTQQQSDLLALAITAKAKLAKTTTLLNGLQPEVDAAVSAMQSLEGAITPAATDRTFFKYTGPTGAVLSGSSMGNISVDVPRNSAGTLLVADPITRTIGQIPIDSAQAEARAISFDAGLVGLFPSHAVDADGNGLPDDIDAVISKTPLSRAAVQDLLQGVDPAAAGVDISGTIARIATLGPASLVASGNGVAYVATITSLLQVIDVTRPTSPSVLGNIALSGPASDLDVRGTELAVGELGGKVEVFDTTDPAARHRLIEVSTTPGRVSVALDAKQVIFNDGSTLRSFDLRTSTQSSELALPGSGAVEDIQLTNDTVFAVRSDAASHVVTVISAALNTDGTLTLLDSLAITNSAAGQRVTLAGGDGVLFVGDVVATGQPSPGFATVNISDSAQLRLIADAQAVGVAALEVTGSGQAVALGSDPASPALLVFDVSDPANTGNLQKTIPLFAQSGGVAIGGGIGFVASGAVTLDVVRFTRPDQGTQAPTVGIASSIPSGLLVEGSTASVHVAARDDVQIARVELVAQGNNVLATDTTFPFDLDFLPPGSLPNGQTVTLAARAIDTGGNVAMSTPLTFNYHAIPPHVIATTPMPGAVTQLTVSTVTLQFDKQISSNGVALTDATLIGAGADRQFGTADDVVVAIAGLRFGVDGKQLTASLSAPLDIGLYRFTVAGAKITDRGGNQLDGEFGGTFPTGDGTFGGNFVYGFEVAGKVSSIFPIPIFSSGGDQPSSIATADFDKDGHPDIAVASSSGNVGILFGAGDGSFEAVQTLTGLAGAAAIGAADLNKDGYADLVVGFAPGNAPSQIAIFKNNGNGTFAMPVMKAVAALGKGNIVFADVNNDGSPDMLVPASPVAVLLNDGAGNFGAATQIANLNGYEIASGDVNNDGRIDVFAGPFNGNSGVALGNGNGTFGTPVVLPDIQPNDARLLEITGDAKADLVYTTGNLRGGALNVMRGNGDGTFGAAISVTAGNDTSLLLADIDGDNRVDAITTGGTTGMSVFRGIPGGFAAGVNYNVPLSAYQAVLGDWDSDGKADVAVTDLGGTIGLVFGKGSGAFTAASRPAVLPRSPVSFASGDVNRDGNLDVVAADSAFYTPDASSITVYLGNGSHGFSKAVTFDAGTVANSLALGDLNGDGNLDVVTVTTTDDSVSVFLGNGDGTFRAPTRIAVFDFPTTVRVADVTGDNILDIITGSGGTFRASTISILPGNGNGTFGARSDLANADSLQLLLTADVNGDNRQDLITASISASATTTAVTIRLGNGNGTFGAPNTTTVPFLTAVLLADVNNDGRLDLITGDFASGTMSVGVRLGNGNGTFAATPISKTVASFPSSLVVADFTRDGNPDIVVSSSGSAQILTGSGDGNFANAVDTTVKTRVLLTGNFGADTDPDLITGEGGLGVNSGNGDGTFAAASSLAPGQGPADVTLGDINGDGKLDAVTANKAGNSVSVVLGGNDGSFGLPVDYPVGKNPVALKVGDFNGDGRLDVITANDGSGDASLLLAQAGGGFARALPLTLGTFVQSPQALAVGDLNGDMKLDFVTANFSGNVSVRLGNGDGTFAAPSIFAVGGAQHDVSLGDINGDGHLDIVSVAQGSPTTVSILINDGTGVFGAPTAITETAFVNRAALGDLDGDGHLDLVTTRFDNSGQGSVSVRLNNGNGTFGTAMIISAPDFQAGAIVLGDVTGDGRLDILTTYSALGGFAVLVNTGGGTFEMPRNFATFGRLFGTVGGLALGNLNGDNKLDVVIVDGAAKLAASLNAG